MEIPLMPQDKANHDLWGSLIATVVSLALMLVLLVARLTGVHLQVPPWSIGIVSLAAVIVAAAVKEWVYDAAHADVHTVDPLDFWATFGGGFKVSAPLVLLGALL
jgi:hypothetical protein